MNARIIAGILALAALGLGVSLYLTSKKADSDRKTATSSIASLSNQLVRATTDLNEQKKVNVVLDTDLTQRSAELESFSNKWTSATSTLAKVESQAKAAAEAAAADIAKRDRQITDLEGEKDDLTRRMGELNVAITGLEGQIAQTQSKLDTSEGDRTQLLKELRRLQAEKAELERKFQDLAVLREQVHKLREELSIARRLDFIRRGLYGFETKGATLLQRGVRPATNRLAPGAADLNVEIRSEGGARVVPKTNAPPVK